MINETQLKEIAKRAGVLDVKKFIEAAKSQDEQTIELSEDGAFMTPDEIQGVEARGEKVGYEKGKTAGYEILTKEVKRLGEVEFEGKTAQNIVSALKEKYSTEAGKEPNKKIEELEADKKKLQLALTEKETEVTTLKNNIDNIYVESEIKTKLPEKLENGLTREDIFTLYQANRKVVKTEHGYEIIDIKKNEVLKDKKLNPLKVEDDIATFLDRFGVTKPDGRKEGDKSPGKNTNIEGLKKRTDVEAYLVENKIPFPEHAAIMAKAMKNEGFDING